MKHFLSAFSLATTAALLASCSSKSNDSVASDDGGAPVDSGGPADAAVADAGGNPFQAVEDELFKGKWNTEGLVIMIDGKIVDERYAAGFTATMPHLTYSVSKSIGATLIGLAIQDGLMNLTDSVCTAIPSPMGADPTLCATTIEHLLHMSDGLAWAEDYGVDPTTSNVLQMLYGYTPDMGTYAVTQPRMSPTNTVWYYSSGESDILALAFKNALKTQDARAYAKTKLFDPVGITSSIFESDQSGTLVFSSSWFATPRDMAKMGQLYLDDGMVGTTRVLPAGWVKYAITPAPTVATPTKRDPMEADPDDTGGSYGADVWLNAVSASATQDTWLYPGATADTYSFEGHYGQKVFVVPSRKMVLVRVGNDRDPEYDPSPTMTAAVAAADALAGSTNHSHHDHAASATPAASMSNREALARNSEKPGLRGADIPNLLTGFSAKETCSCAFVVGQTDTYCTAFGQQAGFKVDITIDHTAQKVTATYVTTTRTATAKAGQGCTLDIP